MKKLIIIAAIVLGTINAGAQTTKVSNDTTVIRSVVRFDKETFVGDKGTHKESYQVLVNREWYPTTKTSYERYFTIKKYGGVPCVVFITPKNKSNATPRVAVL